MPRQWGSMDTRKFWGGTDRIFYLLLHEGDKPLRDDNGGTRGAPIMPRDTVSRTANVERTGRHKWVKPYESVAQ